MIAQIITAIATVANAAMNATAHIAELWPVAVMVAMFIIGVGISFVTGLLGKRRRGRKK